MDQISMHEFGRIFLVYMMARIDREEWQHILLTEEGRGTEYDFQEWRYEITIAQIDPKNSYHVLAHGSFDVAFKVKMKGKNVVGMWLLADPEPEWVLTGVFANIIAGYTTWMRFYAPSYLKDARVEWEKAHA